MSVLIDNPNIFKVFGVGPSLNGPTPPSLAVQFLLQCATTVFTVDASSNGTITFPSPFPNGLITFLAYNGDGGVNVNTVLSDISTSLSQAVVRVWNANTNSGFASGTAVRVNWLAVGW